MRVRTFALLASLAAAAAALRRRRAARNVAGPPLLTGAESYEEPLADEAPIESPAPPAPPTPRVPPESPEPSTQERRPLAEAAAAPLVAAPPHQAAPEAPGPAEQPREPEDEADGDEVPAGWEVVVPPPRRAHLTVPLRGISEIRHFFRTNDVPVWFVSATPFALLGIDRWVRRFTYVSYCDPFDGRHPNTLVPRHVAPPAFDSLEAVNAYLLGHEDVVRRIRADGGGKAVFLALDEEMERLALENGLEVALPGATLRKRLSSRIEATRLANEAGVPSVPNVLGRARSYDGLVSLARGAGLGDDLAVQTPYGAAGQSTFFVASRADWDEHERQLIDEHLKVMRRISCREATVEAVVTRHGTLVGPLLLELTRHPEPQGGVGGWCADDVPASALTDRQRSLAREYAQRLGERLHQEGYRGAFELGIIADLETGELYLGALEPRLTGRCSLTNISAVARDDPPLFLFHLLEFMDVDYELDVAALNESWSQPDAAGGWSQLVLRDTTDTVEEITGAPSSGIWRLDPGAPGGITLVRPETDWRSVTSEAEAFYLGIARAGGRRRPGGDLGVLVMRGSLRTDDHGLTDRARTWITGIEKQFVTRPVESTEPTSTPAPVPFSRELR